MVRTYRVDKLSKNLATLLSLKLMVLIELLAFGVRTDVGCLFRTSVSPGGTFHLFATENSYDSCVTKVP